jgi:polysaccharide export outer membrane protein
MTLLEVLSRAGSTTPAAGDEALIVRAQKGKEPSDDNPDENSVRVNIRQLQTGAVNSNVALRDGDTIFVPRAQSVYIYGQVRSPGAYSIEQGTTVLQALSLAGGLSDRGSSARIRIIRLVDGKKKEVKVKMDDVVAPGDTIVVPERFF